MALSFSMYWLGYFFLILKSVLITQPNPTQLTWSGWFGSGYVIENTKRNQSNPGCKSRFEANLRWNPWYLDKLWVGYGLICGSTIRFDSLSRLCVGYKPESFHISSTYIVNWDTSIGLHMRIFFPICIQNIIDELYIVLLIFFVLNHSYCFTTLLLSNYNS